MGADQGGGDVRRVRDVRLDELLDDLLRLRAGGAVEPFLELRPRAAGEDGDGGHHQRRHQHHSSHHRRARAPGLDRLLAGWLASKWLLAAPNYKQLRSDSDPPCPDQLIDSTLVDLQASCAGL